MAVAMTALFVALGGTGYAASQLGHRVAARVPAKHHKGACVAALGLCSNLRVAVDQEVDAYVVSRHSQLRGPVGATGANGTSGGNGTNGINGTDGTNGTSGPTGPRGPSDVWQSGDGSLQSSAPPLSVSVPAGNFLVVAKTVALSGSGYSACFLNGGSASDNGYGANTTNVEQMTITNVETTHLSAPGTITLSCFSGGGNTVGYAKLTATQIGAVH
jgi:hypothetical protein